MEKENITIEDIANFLKNEIDKKFNENLNDIFELLTVLSKNMELATKAINILNTENILLTAKIKIIEAKINDK